MGTFWVWGVLSEESRVGDAQRNNMIGSKDSPLKASGCQGNKQRKDPNQASEVGQGESVCRAEPSGDQRRGQGRCRGESAHRAEGDERPNKTLRRDYESILCSAKEVRFYLHSTWPKFAVFCFLILLLMFPNIYK